MSHKRSLNLHLSCSQCKGELAGIMIDFNVMELKFHIHGECMICGADNGLDIDIDSFSEYSKSYWEMQNGRNNSASMPYSKE